MTSSSPSAGKDGFAEVIGDPIEHSRSPLIHGFWLDALGIAAEYRAHRVGESEFPAYVASVRSDPRWRGSNVTMPLKRLALDHADEATDRAVAASAANLLLMREGKLFAANTDVGAIATLIARSRDAGHKAGSFTLFGTGGAARAALVAFRLLGINQVRIQARDLAAAKKLAVEFGLKLDPRPLIEPPATDAIVNATPLGMIGHDCLNCDVSRLPQGGLVFDMVSNPADTALTSAARARGLAVVNGLDMLVEQAATSFRLMFGVEPPRDRDPDLRRALGG